MQENIGNTYFFKIELVGQKIVVFCRNRGVFLQARDYLAQFNTPNLVVALNGSDITHEQHITELNSHNRNNALSSCEPYIEALAILRKISEAMLDYNTFLMHGAAVADGEGAYLFTAPSGTGKTTHIKKWLENLPGAYVVNGDKPLVEITAEGAIVHGTPWCGKEKLGCNGKAPLRAVVLQQRGEENRMEEITFGAALPTLLRQSYRPDDPEKMKKTLFLLAELGKRVRFYRFTCNNMKPDAFRTAYDALHAAP